ncbi:MAG: hypothetical protein ACLGHN_07645 [Bacteriovoracia bacterium]
MKTILFPLIVIGLSILGASCTKELKYNKEELLKKAQQADSTVTLILPDSITTGVSCTEYTEGCLSAHIVRVQKLDFIAVEFDKEASALYAAKKFRGFYARNWFFDDVRGEPILEKFVTEKLEAKKP